MAQSDQRRLAADARRIADRKTKGQSRQATEEIRESLRQNYQRGYDAGRVSMHSELALFDPRQALLGSASDFIKTVEGRIAAIPNSTAELRACREAAAILSDACSAVSPLEAPRSRERAA